jgi:transglutaminase-like putative cysteine protease
MEKRGMLILVVLVLLPVCLADSIYNSEEVNVNVVVKGGYQLKQTGASATVKHSSVNLSLFPLKNYRQEPISIKTNPSAEHGEDYAFFVWQNPILGDNEFSLESDIKLKDDFKPIIKKVDFPISEIPDDIKIYLEPSATADSENTDIIRLANSLASKEDDLFIVVHNLAEWTKSNVEYNLSTITASVSRPASWVLENKKGVCDEMTNLFIAMCRSIGIPARFVSGIAYTDSELFTENWGPHGWAEVYFPGYGWIEYDVTYGEFGYIDVTHIELKKALDASSPSSRYSWYGKNAEIRTMPVEMTANLISTSGNNQANIELTIYPEKDDIGFSSYNIINLKIKNKNNHYVSEELRLYTTPEVTLDSDPVLNIPLKPNEEKLFQWIIKVDGLQEGFLYKIPFTIKNVKNITATTDFTSSYNGAVFSKEDMESILSSREQEESKEYSKNVEIECSLEKNEFYSNEENKLSCKVINNGNVYFEKMDVCFKEECKTIELGISQSKTVDFMVTEDESGRKENMLKVRSTEAVRTKTVKYNVLDKPEINITRINHPEEVRFDDKYTIEFVMEKISYSNAKNVEITLSLEEFEESWRIAELSQDRKFIVDLKGSYLIGEENNFEIKVKYEDYSGNSFTDIDYAPIELVDIKAHQKVMLFLNNISRKLFSSQSFFKTLSAITVFFILMIIFIFMKMHRRR